MVKPHYPETHALFNDFYAHPYYLSFFLVGYGLGLPRSTLIWQAMSKNRYILVGLAMCCFVLVQLTAGNVLLHSAYTVLMIAAILGGGYAWLNHANSLLAPYSRAIFPWYIMHQTYIIVIAYWLMPLQLGLWLEASLVVFGTFFACWLSYRWVLLPLPILHRAFGIFPKAVVQIA